MASYSGIYVHHPDHHAVARLLEILERRKRLRKLKVSERAYEGFESDELSGFIYRAYYINPPWQDWIHVVGSISLNESLLSDDMNSVADYLSRELSCQVLALSWQTTVGQECMRLIDHGKTRRRIAYAEGGEILFIDEGEQLDFEASLQKKKEAGLLQEDLDEIESGPENLKKVYLLPDCREFAEGAGLLMDEYSPEGMQIIIESKLKFWPFRCPYDRGNT
ncbi:hypothetical protein JXA32_16905 [Candidatus Sumerlaeota bacterium]|nr:hypothetical protein [Candidatus Sumerlaeota bacterium]